MSARAANALPCVFVAHMAPTHATWVGFWPRCSNPNPLPCGPSKGGGESAWHTGCCALATSRSSSPPEAEKMITPLLLRDVALKLATEVKAWADGRVPAVHFAATIGSRSLRLAVSLLRHDACTCVRLWLPINRPNRRT